MDLNIVYKPNDVICRQGDPSSDLYFLKEGKLLICTVQGTQVKAIARIEPGEFIGELSFFDGKPRATHIVAIERSVVIQLPKEEIMSHLPFWFVEVGKNLTKKIRLLDGIVHSSNFRKIGTEDQKPLSIEEQRLILNAIQK
jgi:CRP/FNR family transcriptional regulator, cyclic AMP receptor protein